MLFKEFQYFLKVSSDKKKIIKMNTFILARSRIKKKFPQIYSPIDILLISYKIKHQKTYIYICCDTFYIILPYIGFYNKHTLCYFGFHTNNNLLLLHRTHETVLS
jgi:hypothetical protein